MKNKLIYALLLIASVMCTACDNTTGKKNGHEWVDLGLPSGTKWATCNIGATQPGFPGSYFAWGETKPKTEFSKKNYKWGKEVEGRANEVTKYCTESVYGPFGTIDNKSTLEPNDDAATVNWGSAWCTPTNEQFTELRALCSWTWTTQNGVNGYQVTSKANGKSIFLPASGVYFSSVRGLNEGALYWSSSVDKVWPTDALGLEFSSGGVSTDAGDMTRWQGQTIRPVLK